MDKSSFITPISEDTHAATDAEGRWVASGSTSVCYRVRHHGKLLLKKQLREDLKDKPSYRDAFRKEFEIGYNLDNDHIVRYHEIIENESDIYILMDYVDGVPLTEFAQLHHKYFHSAKNRKQFIEELLSAVSCLHRHQVLHLDLKPNNIMMTAIGSHVKLIDLGYCYQDSYPFDTGGTPDFTAPEQYSGKYPLSAASDIYAIGHILHDLHIGPHKIVDRCMKENPAERYPTVDALRTALFSKRRLYLRLMLFLLILLAAFAIYELVPRNSSAVQTTQKTGRPGSSYPDNRQDKFAPPVQTQPAVQNAAPSATINAPGTATKSPAKSSARSGNYVQGLLITDTIGNDDPRTMQSEPLVLPNASRKKSRTGVLIETTSHEWYVVTDPITLRSMRALNPPETAEEKEFKKDLLLFTERVKENFAPVRKYLEAKPLFPHSVRDRERLYFEEYQILRDKAFDKDQKEPIYKKYESNTSLRNKLEKCQGVIVNQLVNLYAKNAKALREQKTDDAQ